MMRKWISLLLHNKLTALLATITLKPVNDPASFVLMGLVHMCTSSQFPGFNIVSSAKDESSKGP